MKHKAQFTNKNSRGRDGERNSLIPQKVSADKIKSKFCDEGVVVKDSMESKIHSCLFTSMKTIVTPGLYYDR